MLTSSRMVSEPGNYPRSGDDQPGTGNMEVINSDGVGDSDNSDNDKAHIARNDQCDITSEVLKALEPTGIDTNHQYSE